LLALQHVEPATLDAALATLAAAVDATWGSRRFGCWPCSM